MKNNQSSTNVNVAHCLQHLVVTMHFILFAFSANQRRVRLMVPFKRDTSNINNKVARARAIVKACTGNARFPAGTFKIPLLTVSGHIKDVADGQVDLLNKKIDSEVRNTLLLRMFNDFDSLMSDVQRVMDANPTEAEAIAGSALLNIKITNPYVKPELKVANKENAPGTVILTSKAAPRSVKATYEWETSRDCKKWTLYRPSTSHSKREIKDLKPMKKLWFRRRIIIDDQPQEWSFPVWIIVH